MRVLVLAVIAGLLAGCSSASGSSDESGRKVSAHHDLAALVSVPVRIKSGFGTGIQGFTISGTVVNHETTDLACTNAVFSVLVGKTRRAPVGGFCTRGKIAPNEAAEFSMTFPMIPSENPVLRFDHTDGTYESADLAIPPPEQ